jgi:F420-dependent oxidoreductase-like protein
MASGFSGGIMTAISLMIEGQDGLNWGRWQRLASEAEELGFAGLFRSDHYTNSVGPDKDSLEMVVSLTYLASHTKRIHFGPLVAPLSFREPTMLARQAAAIDDLSGGRMIIGIGAGWQEREHTLFGHDLGDIPTRMARLEEGLEVISKLLKSDEPVEFSGQHYNLRGATLLPRPQRQGGPDIMIGGNGPKRTLPLAARYATIWNGVFLSPEAFSERNAILDELMQAEGRQPSELRRTMMGGLYFGRDEAALEQKLSRFREGNEELKGLSLSELSAYLRKERNLFTGTADEVVAQIQTYQAAGADELMLQWLDLDDIDNLHAFAEQVLPRVA